MKNEKISQARKKYWANISKEKKSEMFKKLALLKHSRETKLQKRLSSRIMFAGKMQKEKLLFGYTKMVARIERDEKRAKRKRHKISKANKKIMQEVFGRDQLLFKR